jgi:hypothetical protein
MPAWFRLKENVLLTIEKTRKQKIFFSKTMVVTKEISCQIFQNLFRKNNRSSFRAKIPFLPAGNQHFCLLGSGWPGLGKGDCFKSIKGR